MNYSLLNSAVKTLLSLNHFIPLLVYPNDKKPADTTLVSVDMDTRKGVLTTQLTYPPNRVKVVVNRGRWATGYSHHISQEC